MVICQVRNLTRTSTAKEITGAYKELGLQAPADMAFDTPAMPLMYYDALKPRGMRHIDLDQATNLQSLYCEVGMQSKRPMPCTKHKPGKEKTQQLSPPGPSSPPAGNCGKFDSLVINSLKLDSLVVDTIVK
ncbi:hypothetical protein DSO57_1030648 [Entomophthora muscae]|uniref:Uncharacterized protein n=1 Tax=Entomophthora muscae TaxID=34485 RepID=A0ACC2T0X5_9FUNG|nr:hypothetical protein DSO57_1030648 [Entomophthora muscae]